MLKSQRFQLQSEIFWMKKEDMVEEGQEISLGSKDKPSWIVVVVQQCCLLSRIISMLPPFCSILLLDNARKVWRKRRKKEVILTPLWQKRLSPSSLPSRRLSKSRGKAKKCGSTSFPKSLQVDSCSPNNITWKPFWFCALVCHVHDWLIGLFFDASKKRVFQDQKLQVSWKKFYLKAMWNVKKGKEGTTSIFSISPLSFSWLFLWRHIIELQRRCFYICESPALASSLPSSFLC